MLSWTISTGVALRHDAGVLQEVVGNGGTLNEPMGVEMHLDELAKPRRVVVAERLGVTERLRRRAREAYISLPTPGGEGPDRPQYNLWAGPS